ncbi:MAG TPA: RidA family protein [Bryobacteraceae bacterium]|jgi:enamine deaminase RidA (YjgF/YER057c/UK114 family)
MNDMSNEKKNSRRTLLKRGATAAGVFAAAAGAEVPIAKAAEGGLSKRVHYPKPAKIPLFSAAVSYGNLLFLSGKGAHYEGDIKQHTKTVLDDLEKELVNAGSSMEKVLKVTVFLAKAEDYAPMNEVFHGRFGSEPPVRTTVAAAWIPGNSLVEMDVIAYI